uniref:Uncharacterized protein n=1 Tax=Zea mays TaxID=4577 RepID=A0A804R1K2_MAIZE
MSSAPTPERTHVSRELDGGLEDLLACSREWHVPGHQPDDHLRRPDKHLACTRRGGWTQGIS